MCALCFLDLIGSCRKDTLSKQQTSERLQRCLLHLRFCFKKNSWRRVFFFPVWIVRLPIRHYTIGKEIVDLVLDRIRKLADNCTGQQTESSVRFLLYCGIAIIHFLDVDGLQLDEVGSFDNWQSWPCHPKGMGHCH